MTNIGININLAKFKMTGVMNLQGKTGIKRCLVIPLEDNHIYEGEKGVYVSFTAWGTDKLPNNKTHIIKQSLPKAILDKMSKDELNNLPVFGDAKPLTAHMISEETYQIPNNQDKDAPF